MIYSCTLDFCPTCFQNTFMSYVTRTHQYYFFFLSWCLQNAYICDRLCHILSLLRVWDVVVGQSLSAVPSKGFTQARNIGFYLTAMFINTVNMIVIGY